MKSDDGIYEHGQHEEPFDEILSTHKSDGEMPKGEGHQDSRTKRAAAR